MVLVYAYFLCLGFTVLQHSPRYLRELSNMNILAPTHPITAAVLSKLQVIKNQRLATANVVERSGQQSLLVAFDVYQPGVNFKKTNPGPPDFCITVCRYCDCPPSLASLALLSQKCSPVPLKIALVDGGNILFYSVLDVDSPTFISRG